MYNITLSSLSTSLLSISFLRATNVAAPSGLAYIPSLLNSFIAFIILSSSTDIAVPELSLITLSICSLAYGAGTLMPEAIVFALGNGSTLSFCSSIAFTTGLHVVD